MADWIDVFFLSSVFPPFSPTLSISLEEEIALTVAVDLLHDSVLKVNRLPVETIDTRRHPLAEVEHDLREQ